jgi:hypothetical protein
MDFTAIHRLALRRTCLLIKFWSMCNFHVKHN